MCRGQLKVMVDGDPQSVAEFFRAMGEIPLSGTCATGSSFDPDKISRDCRAAMEFERLRQVFGNPGNFERK